MSLFCLLARTIHANLGRRHPNACNPEHNVSAACGISAGVRHSPDPPGKVSRLGQALSFLRPPSQQGWPSEARPPVSARPMESRPQTNHPVDKQLPDFIVAPKARRRKMASSRQYLGSFDRMALVYRHLSRRWYSSPWRYALGGLPRLACRLQRLLAFEVVWGIES